MSEKDKVIFNEDYSLAIMPSASAVISTDIKSITKTTTSVSKEASSKDIMAWGDGNDFPQKVIEDVRRDPEIGTLLNKQAALLYSGGIEWGIPKIINGKEVLTPLSDADNLKIKTWLRRTNFNRYLLEASKDLYWFYNVFVEIILQGDASQIIQIATQPAEECRLGKQNEKTGLVEMCYINAQWPNGSVEDPLTKKIKVLDSYYSPADQLRAQQKALNFIYPISHATPGCKFYQLPEWNSIRESGWLEVSQAIPTLKKAILKNQMTIKYHVRISNMYWEKKYSDWNAVDKKTQIERKQTELAAMEATLSGAENSGKSLTSVIYHDFNLGKEFELIKIDPIDDKIQKGQYLEEGKDASLYKMSAIGLHPALTGLTPNSGLGGAGSNIREAYNLHVMTHKPNQDLILEPLNNLIIDFNGWPSEMEFRFKNQFMTTLDAGRETQPLQQTQTSE